ncbi:MAG: ATP-binding cassette domain-containing protein, partial [Ferrovibrionaceae bacterium]
PLLEVVGLSKTFRTSQGLFVRRRREVHALRQVSLTIHRGETVGLVGESGSGKTTLGHAIVRLVDTDAGEIRFRGADILAQGGARLRTTRARIQMVFQDPFASLNPRHSVGRILTETPRIHGVGKAEAETRARRLLELVGLDASAFGRYPHEFSGGQRQRIGIARALALEPELIVADEPVSALDVSVQGQVLDLLADIRKRLGLAMLFITHDLRVAAQVCDTIAVMRRGELVEIGPAAEVFGKPRHDYTRRLLASVPGAGWTDRPGTRLTAG